VPMTQFKARRAYLLSLSDFPAFNFQAPRGKLETRSLPPPWWPTATQRDSRTTCTHTSPRCLPRHTSNRLPVQLPTTQEQHQPRWRHLRSTPHLLPLP
jgi:hypothetical protein